MRVWALALIGAAILISCSSESLAPLQKGTASARDAIGKTNAWGVLVDDPSGAPLAGVPVRLEPWKHGCVKTSAHTARCPGYLRWSTTTARNGRFVLEGVPNGEYLLVIGSNSPHDLTRPTIHDHVTFIGGIQELEAPRLPTIPCNQQNYIEWCQGAQPSPNVTPFPRPRAERDGLYRLTTIDRDNERPCAVAFNAQRAKRRLPLVVVDEWLTENAREINAYRISNGTHVAQPVPWLTSAQVLDIGKMTCNRFAALGFVGALRFAADPRTSWFGGVLTAANHQDDGAIEFPVDPRALKDRYVGPWP